MLFAIVYSKDAANPNPFGVSPGTGIAIETKDGLQFRGGGVFPKSSTLLFSARSNSSSVRSYESLAQSPDIMPFDYRGFGYAFYGDLITRATFAKCLQIT